MIISHKYKFIFIKTKKVAGTSIEVFLSQSCAKNDIVTPIYPHVNPHFARNYKGLWSPITEIIECRGKGIKPLLLNLVKRNKFYSHISALKVKNRVSKKIWNNYFKFCVERNPWDKILSHFHMIRARTDGNMTLSQYFEKSQLGCRNYHLYTNQRGNLMVDKIIKYESLIEELSQIFDILGIPFYGDLGVRAKSEYRKEKRYNKKKFTKEQRALVEKVFAKEIKMHGYTFDNFRDQKI